MIWYDDEDEDDELLDGSPEPIPGQGDDDGSRRRSCMAIPPVYAGPFEIVAEHRASEPSADGSRQWQTDVLATARTMARAHEVCEWLNARLALQGVHDVRYVFRGPAVRQEGM